MYLWIPAPPTPSSTNAPCVEKSYPQSTPTTAALAVDGVTRAATKPAGFSMGMTPYSPYGFVGEAHPAIFGFGLAELILG